MIIIEVNIEKIRNQFKESRKSILAIGDETRQSILITLMDGDKDGMRVGEITKKTHLSRPAVSHHLKILKDANIISIRKDGTMNFYYLNPDIEEIERLNELCKQIIAIMKEGCESCKIL